MSIEKLLSDLIVAINENTATLRASAGNGVVVQVPPVPPAPVVAPIQAYVAPVAQAPAPVAQLLPVATPTFASPVAAPANKAPFTDVNGMIQYVMAAYQAMGADKGAKIQGILAQLGHDNINNVRPDQFDSLYLAVEQLKVS